MELWQVETHFLPEYTWPNSPAAGARKTALNDAKDERPRRVNGLDATGDRGPADGEPSDIIYMAN